MARAKQTARAEARRRYRSANRLEDEAAPNELEGVDETAANAGARPARGSAADRSATARSSSGSRQAAPARPGVLSAFRGAYHPANFREDLAVLPSLLRSRALLGAIGLIILGAVIYIAAPGYQIPVFLFQTLTYPPAIAPIFIVGFFAPRASYMLGFIVGIVDAAIFSLLVLGATTLLGQPTDPSAVPSLIGSAFFTGAVTGTVFASAAAWYRRFLALSSPRSSKSKGGAKGRQTAKASNRR